MKSLYILSSLVIASALFTSCEKVIDIDLNDSESKVVIEGIVTDEPGPYTVKITKSINFDQSNTFPGVTNSEVIINDDLGNVDTLVESSPGIYQTTNLVGKPGHTYYLNIKNSDGKKFSSSCYMPLKVNLDSVRVDSINFGGSYSITLYPQFLDPIGIRNYYRFKLKKNDEAINSIYLQDDQFSDGLVMLQPLIDPEADIKYGDLVTVEMLCIDKPINLYWFSLDLNVSEQSATPANPVSNINGGALGYFSAQTRQVRTVQINR
jgi:hypothetical protein